MFNTATDCPTSEELPSFEDKADEEQIEIWLKDNGLWEDGLNQYQSPQEI